jgi:mono/diheme cytochrome c family protein
MKAFKRASAILGVLLALAVTAFAVYVAARQNLKFDRPPPDLHASLDPAVIERGRYVVRNLSGCGLCHADGERLREVSNGDLTVPLSGGHEWDIPPGKFRAINITPDKETGIGLMTDGQIARALRHGIGRDGRALLPFMEVQGLSDDDLVAVISYLRNQPPVRKAVPRHEFSLLGKVIKATLLANPVGPSETPLVHSPRGPTVENGRYLVEKVVNCWACHTERSMKTGKMTGPRFAGGRNHPDPFEPTVRTWSAPNITSAPNTGRLAQWNEDQFVARMRAGPVYKRSPMPWIQFSKLAEDDIRAIYRYLKTVPAVENDVGSPVVELKH